MSNKDIENWLLSSCFFVDCRGCVRRKEGCYKDCKFYHSYRRNGETPSKEKNMSEEKQIEEMASDLENHTCMSKFQAEIASRTLHILGYRKQSGWISVEERLPEYNTDVLVHRGGFIGDLVNVYTYKGENKWEDEYGYWSRTDDEAITHWMPLPDPTKGEAHE